jgi:hypothetical protein
MWGQSRDQIASDKIANGTKSSILVHVRDLPSHDNQGN